MRPTRCSGCRRRRGEGTAHPFGPFRDQLEVEDRAFHPFEARCDQQVVQTTSPPRKAPRAGGQEGVQTDQSCAIGAPAGHEVPQTDDGACKPLQNVRQSAPRTGPAIRSAAFVTTTHAESAETHDHLIRLGHAVTSKEPETVFSSVWGLS